MWIISETTQGTWMEWWAPETLIGERRLPNMRARLVIASESNMAIQQWELIKKQFENLALHPRFPS